MTAMLDSPESPVLCSNNAELTFVHPLSQWQLRAHCQPASLTRYDPKSCRSSCLRRRATGSGRLNAESAFRMKLLELVMIVERQECPSFAHPIQSGVKIFVFVACGHRLSDLIIEAASRYPGH
jgi:hypothetical protein